MESRIQRNLRSPLSAIVFAESTTAADLPAGPREPAVISFRRFKNTDPPALADVWNESHPARSAYPLRTPALLERWVFSKPYFDPDGLIVAVDDADNNKVVGYVLAGFGPNEELTALDYSQGVICSLGVRPSVQRSGVARDLVGKAEEYLTSAARRPSAPGRVALLPVRLRHLRRNQRARLPRLRRRRGPVLPVARLRTRRHHPRLPQEARCTAGGPRRPLRAPAQALRDAGAPRRGRAVVVARLRLGHARPGRVPPARQALQQLPRRPRGGVGARGLRLALGLPLRGRHRHPGPPGPAEAWASRSS